MQRLRLYFLLILTVLTLGTATAPATAQASHGNVVSVNSFFEPLAAHGDWHYTQQYGWVWSPYRVAAHWQPYSVGHWAWTDSYGWMWVSDEAWGWAAYHYGRWVVLGGSWVWVPGTTWGPAWVAWSYTDNYVGWAPLPPSATVSSYTGTVNINVNIGWQSWVYVPGVNMMAVNLSPYYLPPARIQTIWHRARPATRYRIHRGAVTCLGPAEIHINRWLGHRPPSVTISYASTPVNQWHHGATVYVYRTPPPPRSAYYRTPPPPRRSVPPALRGSVVKPPPTPAHYRQPASTKSRTTVKTTTKSTGSRGYAPPPPSSRSQIKTRAPAPSSSSSKRRASTSSSTTPPPPR